MHFTEIQNFTHNFMMTLSVEVAVAHYKQINYIIFSQINY